MMEILTLDLPTLYGDHHVTEVRRLFLDIPGVDDVYASSCFQVVRVTYDPGRTDAAAIHARLDAAGYLADVSVPLEADAAQSPDSPDRQTRRTTTYPQTGRVIGFAQHAQEHQHGEKRA